MTLGITDGTSTEVVSGLQEGERVVVGQAGAAGGQNGGRPGGGPGGGIFGGGFRG